MEDPYSTYTVDKRNWIPQMRRRSIPLAQVFNPNYNTPTNFRMGKETRDELEFLPPINRPNYLFDDNENTEEDDSESSTAVNPEDIKEFYPMLDYIYKFRTTTENFRNLPLRTRYKQLKSLLNEFSSLEQPEDIDIDEILNRQIEKEETENVEENGVVPERFEETYNTPDNFRAGWESKDLLNEDIPESRIYVNENEDDYPEEYGSGSHTEPEEIFRELKQLHTQQAEEEQSDIPRYSNDDEIFRELKQMQKSEENSNLVKLQPQPDKIRDLDTSGLYTEGGVVYAPDSKLIGKLILYIQIPIFN